MTEKQPRQPKEVYALFFILIIISNFIWIAKISLEFKAVFYSVLFMLFLASTFIFIELEKLRMENIHE